MQFFDYVTEFQRAKRLASLRISPSEVMRILWPHMQQERPDAWEQYQIELGVAQMRSLVDNPSHFYAHYIHATTKIRGDNAIVDPFTGSLAMAECMWTADRRPFYNLWPSILPALAKLDLSKAESTHFRLPLNRLLLRLPMRDNPFTFHDRNRDWQVRTVLCENTVLLKEAAAGHAAGTPLSVEFAQQAYNGGASNEEYLDMIGSVTAEVDHIPEGCVRGVCIWIDIEEPLSSVRDLDDGNIVPVMQHPLAPTTKTYRHFGCCPGMTIVDSLQAQRHHMSAGFGVRIPEDIIQDLFKVVATLCLFDNDPDIVEPLVLNKDKEKFDRTGDPKYVEKAKARGNYGWDIGRKIEVSPHVRSASPAALYWTGPGRKTPRIRFRKGCVVKRHRMAEVPTGYLDDEKGTE